MAQHDYVIANDTAANVRSDINSALAAIVSNNSGDTAPATTYANQLWYDSANNILKIRSEANDAWINVGYLDQSNGLFQVFDDTKVVDTSGTQTGLIGDQTQADWEAGTSTTESLVSPAKVAAAIAAQAAGLTADVQEFTSSGTWTKPANAKLVYVELWGAGGGGGSGRRGATSTARSGGGGGGSGGIYGGMFRASELTSTISVTIGAGGTGAAAVTTNDTNGNAGTSGGQSSFGTYAVSGGGDGGAGGINANTSTTYGGNSALQYSGNLNGSGGAAGGRSLTTSGGASGARSPLGYAGGQGGGGGGSISSANVIFNAGVGGSLLTNASDDSIPVGTGVASGDGAAGTDFTVGGGGGGASSTANAGSGGAGGRANGGGGGGASLNGYNSGAGGAGGDGFCRVTTYY